MTIFTQAQDTRAFPALYVQDPSGIVLPEPKVFELQPYALAHALLVPPPVPVNHKLTPLEIRRNGLGVIDSVGGFNWFEDFHVIPRAFDFGNLLSSQSIPMEVFNAHRRGSQEWTSFVNNAGAGVELGGIPSLPTQVDAMSGLQMTLDVSTSGEPFVDATLDFVFSGTGTAMVPILIQRIVLWGLAPEQPYSETFGSLTDVIQAKSGKEKRSSGRKNPRQSWDYEYIAESGIESATLENLLFDFQSRVFGVPVWRDDSRVTVTVVPGDTVINVDATAFRDLREGGFVVLLTSQGVFDVLQISAGGITATTITLESPVINAYVVGTEVFPLAPCRAQSRVSGTRHTTGLQTFNVRFSPVDNDVDLADLSPFSTYRGSLFMDLGNSMNGKRTKDRSFTQKLIRADNGSGLVYQATTWPNHKGSTSLVVRAQGRQAIWELIGMVHALRGRQVTFYLPTDNDDLVPVSNLLSASNVLDVHNVGFSQFVRQRAPHGDLRVTLNDGTEYLREITGSTASSPTVDQLTLGSNWPSTILFGDVARIDYVEKVRFDTDRVRLEFDDVGSVARLVVPVTAVLE